MLCGAQIVTGFLNLARCDGAVAVDVKAVEHVVPHLLCFDEVAVAVQHLNDLGLARPVGVNGLHDAVANVGGR